MHRIVDIRIYISIGSFQRRKLQETRGESEAKREESRKKN